jgi:hypothetical protein
LARPKKKQHRADRRLEAMLELVERVVRVRRLDEQPGVARRVREKRDDRNQGERRV